MKRHSKLTAKRVAEAKALFNKASRHAGDSAQIGNYIAEGLSKLTEAIADIHNEIGAMRTAGLGRRDKA